MPAGTLLFPYSIAKLLASLEEAAQKLLVTRAP
jgi:hypothetical protein